MPLIAALLGGLISIAGTLVGRVLVGLGIGVVTFTGFQTALSWIMNAMQGAAGGLPGDLIGIINYIGVGQYVSIVTSAMAIRMALDGLTGESIKRWVTK